MDGFPSSEYPNFQGAVPIFRGKLAVSFREGSLCRITTQRVKLPTSQTAFFFFFLDKFQATESTAGKCHVADWIRAHPPPQIDVLIGLG